MRSADGQEGTVLPALRREAAARTEAAVSRQDQQRSNTRQNGYWAGLTGFTD
jgi:hypothetical protein